MSQFNELFENHEGEVRCIEIDITKFCILKSHMAELLSHKKNILLLDLDGTLRCDKQRHDLLPTKEALVSAGDTPNIAYMDYHLASDKDTVIQKTLDAVKQYNKSGYFIVVLTSCMYTDRTATIICDQVKSWGVPIDSVVMRGEDNQQYPVDMKTTFIKEMIPEGSRHLVEIMDDTVEIIESAKLLGLQTHLVIS